MSLMKPLFHAVFALFVLFSAPVFALTDAENAALKQAESYLNAISTMQARFLQVNPDGSSHEGDLFVSRPGKMRLVYDEPAPMLMVADGVWLIYVDKEMDEVSHIDLDDTPAGLLLKDNLSFTDKAIALKGVKIANGTVEISAAQAKDPGTGTLTLVFTQAPFELRQWRVIDAQNQEIAVTLFDAKMGVPVDAKLFRYDAPRDERRD